jgi:hypothetical protein
LIFQGIEILAPEKKEAIPKIRELSKEYQQEKDSAYQRTAEALRAKWQSLGISGSAVVPKVAESSEWEVTLKALRPAYEARLQALKNEIR